MPKNLIITDDVDLTAKNKDLLSHDSIYKKTDGKATHINISDATHVNSELKSGVYAILSVSDKVINNRLYDYDSLKKNVMNKDWLNPYKRPFLRNHDVYSDMPSGRINRAWFIDHSNLSVSCPTGEDKLPEKVLQHYKDISCFDEGTGSTIVEIMTTEHTYDRIKSGLDMTVSQSSYMGKAVCNICHQDYFGGKCTHYAGEEYEIEEDKQTVKKTCYVECRDFEPVELSIVNNPANNSSILYVLEDETSTSASKDDGKQTDDTKIDNSTNNVKVKGTENNIKDSDEGETTTEEKTIKTEDLMSKNLLKKIIGKNVSDKFGEDLKEHFESLFDSLETEDQIEKLQAFLDAIETSEEVEEKEPEANEDDKQDETNNEDNSDNNPEPEDTTDESTTEPTVEPKANEGTEDSTNKKAEDLSKVYSNKKAIKDNVINRTVAAIIKNLN